MNPFDTAYPELKNTLLALGAGATSYGSVAAVTLIEVKETVAIGVMLLGGASTVYAMYWMRKSNRIRLAEWKLELCAQCRANTEPDECPIPEKHRPPNCPKERRKLFLAHAPKRS